jgi:DNA-binding transcriptional MocR family regulator
MWIPDISRRGGPRYAAIVEAITEDIELGRLKPGDQMPTHRELANSIGVTTGTITRAYSEAARRGLLVGETGRGTFVKGNLFEEALVAPPSGEDEALIDLSFNTPPPPTAGDLLGQALAKTLSGLSTRHGLSSLLAYQPAAGVERHRAAGVEWVARAGLKARTRQVLVCNGALHAMTVVFSTICKPGDTVFTENLTYPGMKNLANLLNLRLHGLPVDEQGIVPRAFDEACRRIAARALYTIPTVQNPLGTVTPESRRREIAAVAAAHGVAIVEDDVHSFMLPSPPPPLSSFAPENSYYILSTSKSIAGGMRVGYLVAPERMVEPLSTTLRATVWMAAPLMVEIATEWIKDGTADSLVEQKRAEAAARQEIARRVFEGFEFDAHPLSFHLWLRLPEPWRSNDFTAQLKRRGVLVTPSEAFVPGREEAPHAVRVCLGTPRSRAQLESALAIVRSVLQSTPDPCLSVL